VREDEVQQIEWAEVASEVVVQEEEVAVEQETVAAEGRAVELEER
jgi:tRNA A37 threonylcarbamoyladenosine biosynthesis protein TsaE